MREHPHPRPAASGARYGHTNLIAREWRTVAAFYETVFGCVPVPPERDYRGDLVERGTGVKDAAFQGVHLRLPGHGPDGPTLEIYGYSTSLDPTATPAANRIGWGHIAFMVDDVAVARAAVLSSGGGLLPDAEIVTTQTADGRRVTWCYLTDPEGNLVELQSWAPAE
ncbi:MAG: VOC family protein [Candidatus Limnocylindria bacterium]